MPDQCRAVTEGGERCSRPAEEGGFCHQHGPEDETVADADAEDSEDAQMNENDDARDDGEESGSDDAGGDSDIVTVKRTVQRDVPALIDRELDGVTSLVREEEGWIATVEIVERHSVPDTQDILGHYEVSLTESADIDGYRRLETYRRAEGPPYEG